MADKIKKIVVFVILLSSVLLAQESKFQRFDSLIGKWSGTGKGFENNKSVINSEFKFIMDGKYIEVINDSKFEPTTKKPNGEHHIDKGYISYDSNRDKFVFRQFHTEGFVIQYILDESLSSNSKLVFITENIENFVPGGKARWVISKISGNEISTSFDVSFPEKEYQSFGENILKRVSK